MKMKAKKINEIEKGEGKGIGKKQSNKEKKNKHSRQEGKG